MVIATKQTMEDEDTRGNREMDTLLPYSPVQGDLDAASSKSTLSRT